MDKEYFDRHHLIPKNPLDEFNAKGLWVDNNIQLVKRSTHEAIHALFRNAPPITQVVNMLEFNKKCFDDEFYAGLLNYIQSYANNWYKRECYKWILREEIRRVLDIES